MKKLMGLMLLMTSSAMASNATTSMHLVGFVPEIMEAKFVGNPPPLDMTPGNSTSSLLVGELNLTYNVPLASIKIKGSTASGMLESADGKPGLESFSMTLGGDGDKCHVMSAARTITSADLTGEGTTIEAPSQGNAAGFDDHCSVRLGWKPLSENKNPGRYAMDVFFTIVSQ